MVTSWIPHCPFFCTREYSTRGIAWEVCHDALVHDVFPDVVVHSTLSPTCQLWCFSLWFLPSAVCTVAVPCVSMAVTVPDMEAGGATGVGVFCISSGAACARLDTRATTATAMVRGLII